jgi:DNA polymerase I
MPFLPGDIQMHLVNNIDTAWEMKRWLGERRDVLGLDTETSGIDPYASDAKLRLIQIGDHKTGWAIPWEQWGGVAVEILNAYEDGPIALHNASFDERWLRKHGNVKLPWHRIHDTMIMAQIDRPGMPASLKGLSVELVDPRADAGQKDLKAAMKANGWDWGNIPIDLPSYWIYSALDPILTAHLWSHFRTDLKYPEVFDLEMSVLRVCSKMEDNGMRVDLDYSQRKHDEMMSWVESSKDWAQKTLGLSIGSNPQLAAYFRDELDAKFDKYTGTGAPSVDKEQMALFQASPDPKVKQLADFVLGVRSAEKKANSYFKNFINMNTDGIVHPSIRTLGARTGRMSVTSPALQTIPRGEALVRDAFIPINEGEGIVSCDYSQVEMRLLSHFSGDEALQRAFREADATGNDFFVGLGKDIYADPNFGRKDPRRNLVKSTMYGAAYGSGLQKMADTAGITYDEMKDVSDAVFRSYPGIRRFMKDVELVGTKRENEEGFGYIITEMGRRLPADKGKVYSLTNYTLQGTAAELMKKALVRLDAAGYSDSMLIPIHDEVVFSLPHKGHKDAMREIGELMSYCNGEFLVDLPAEPEGLFDRWGSKYRKKGEIFGQASLAA